MGRSRLRNQRCIGTCKNGSRCGRYCADGATLCAKHDGSPATGVVAAQETDDPAVILKRLVKDRDPAIRLRALEALLKYQDRHQDTCAACAKRAEADHQQTKFLRGLTSTERDVLIDLLQTMKAFKSSVYDRDPDLKPDDEPPITPIAPVTPPAPAPTSAPVTLAPEADDDDEPIDVEPARESPVDKPKPSGPVPLSRDRYAECGLIELRGQWTHPRGDAHAHRIMSGDISFEDARAAHAAAQRQENQIVTEELRRKHRE